MAIGKLAVELEMVGGKDQINKPRELSLKDASPWVRKS